MTSIKISPQGNFLMYQKEFTPEFVQRTIQEKQLNGLRIFAHLSDQRIESFDFLRKYTFLNGLEIASRDEDSYDFLNSLPNLKHLKLQNEGTIEINLGALIHLESLSIQWRKNITGLEKCSGIKKLVLVDFFEGSLTAVESLTNIEELIVVGSKLKTLQGISKMHLVKHLSLRHCKLLTDIAELNGKSNLEVLEFQTCPAIQNFDALSELPHLESLQLMDSGALASIQFINRLSNLKKVHVSGNTEVQDGNLSPLKNIPDVIIAPRKHYNLTFAADYNKTTREKLESLKKRKMKI